MKRTTAQFILESTKIHNNKYEYTKTIYTYAKEKLIITCKTHGDFKQRADSHLKGYGCPLCGREITNKNGYTRKQKDVDCSTKFFKVHGNRYDYSLAEYKGSSSKISIVCKQHGIFDQTYNDHLQGKGCPFCSVTGFDIRKPASFYILSNSDLSTIKIGITNRHVPKRVSQINSTTQDKFTIQKIYSFSLGKSALDLETHILKFLNKNYIHPSKGFDGATESFKNVNVCLLTTKIEEIILDLNIESDIIE